VVIYAPREPFRIEYFAMDADIIGGFPTVDPNCAGCGKPLTQENAWMTDGCPCNHPLGCNNQNETRWRLLMQLQQAQSRDLAGVLNVLDLMGIPKTYEGNSDGVRRTETYTVLGRMRELQHRMQQLQPREKQTLSPKDAAFVDFAGDLHTAFGG